MKDQPKAQSMDNGLHDQIMLPGAKRTSRVATAPEIDTSASTADKHIGQRIGTLVYEDVFYTLTSGLRKMCDSKPTSLMYNLSHLHDADSNQTWHLVCKDIWNLLEAGTPADKAVKAAFANMVRGRTAFQNAVAITADMFNADDWRACSYYIQEAVRAEKE